MIVFINGVYHSVFQVFEDLDTFKTQFCLNNGLDLGEVEIYEDLTSDQQDQVAAALLNQGSSLRYSAGQAIVYRSEQISDGEGFIFSQETILTIALSPAS
jgi:hypothetical protein